MKYCVAETIGIERLKEEVEQLLRQGWRCQGGVAIMEYKTGDDIRLTMYAQAMIRED